MALIKRTITAGPLTVEAIYPMASPRDSDGVRRGKKNLSTPAQQRLNFKHAWQRLELEIAANFGTGDLYCTLTYDDEHLPRDRAGARAAIAKFLKQLRAARKKRGKALFYIYNIEHAHSEGRWHHHLILNATGDDYDEIRALWVNGLIDFRSLRVDKDKHYETLARYFCKEQREKLGHRLWCCSRNLKKPERDCVRVSNDVRLEPPKNAMVLEDSGEARTVYGRYRYLKYILPGRAGARVRSRRRRR